MRWRICQGMAMIQALLIGLTLGMLPGPCQQQLLLPVRTMLLGHLMESREVMAPTMLVLLMSHLWGPRKNPLGCLMRVLTYLATDGDHVHANDGQHLTWMVVWRTACDGNNNDMMEYWEEEERVEPIPMDITCNVVEQVTSRLSDKEAGPDRLASGVNQSSSALS